MDWLQKWIVTTPGKRTPLKHPPLRVPAQTLAGLTRQAVDAPSAEAHQPGDVADRLAVILADGIGELVPRHQVGADASGNVLRSEGPAIEEALGGNCGAGVYG